jgi:hypothetical protein
MKTFIKLICAIAIIVFASPYPSFVDPGDRTC